MAGVGKLYENVEPDDIKGSGQRGGPGRWTESGPKPSRQIPWPEIFKHHISLIEGHLKMTDMIKKHTIEGSENWDTICKLIDRTKEMLHAAKAQSRIFMPPFDILDQVPIGSSSNSINPEYSAADRNDGKPATVARDQVLDNKPTQFDDEQGQGRRIKRTKLAGIRAAIPAYESGSGSEIGLGLDGLAANILKRRAVNGAAKVVKVDHGTARGETGDAITEKGKPLFVIDVNPTPVDLGGIAIISPKRGASLGDNDEGKKIKRAKTYHNDNDNGTFPPAEAEVEVEFEDISQEVDARLKEKEEKRKRKKEKKRKTGAYVPEATATIEEPERPKKKKKKSRQNHDAAVGSIDTKKRNGAESDEGQGEKRKKKSKKNKDATDS